MRKLIVILIVFISTITQIQGQVIQKNDTLYLNYYIAKGEFGGRNEGIMIYVRNNLLNAKSIKYNHSSTSFILNAFTDFNKNNNSAPQEVEYEMNLLLRDSIIKDALIDYYKKNRNDYTELKPEWILSEKQCNYIYELLDEIRTRQSEDNIFSNASEHYVILSNKESHVYIDRTGKWNKFLEIKKVLEIE